MPDWYHQEIRGYNLGDENSDLNDGRYHGLDDAPILIQDPPQLTLTKLDSNKINGVDIGRGNN